MGVNFTGTLTDKIGRVYYFINGVRVPHERYEGLKKTRHVHHYVDREMDSADAADYGANNIDKYGYKVGSPESDYAHLITTNPSSLEELKDKYYELNSQDIDSNTVASVLRHLLANNIIARNAMDHYYLNIPGNARGFPSALHEPGEPMIKAFATFMSKKPTMVHAVPAKLGDMSNIALLPREFHELIRKVATGDITDKRGRLGGGVNESHIITLDNGVSGLWKPADGEDRGNRYSFMEAAPLWKREVAASEVGELLDMGDLVPITIRREIDNRDGALQLFRDNVRDGGFHIDELEDHDVSRAAAFDYLIGNLDRHGRNWMRTDDDKPYLIDHGYSFPLTNKYTISFNRQMVNESIKRKLPVPPEVAEWEIKRGDFVTILKSVDMEPKAIDAALERFDELVEAGKQNAEIKFGWRTMFANPKYVTLRQMIKKSPLELFKYSSGLDDYIEPSKSPVEPTAEKPTDEQLHSAGKNAFENGRRLSENPFKGGPGEAEWEFGFNSAKAKASEKVGAA